MAAVELLLKKHEAFEKSAATQDERFRALERLTTVSTFVVILHERFLNWRLNIQIENINVGIRDKI